MKNSIIFISLVTASLACSSALAQYEVVCKNYAETTYAQKKIYIDCKNRSNVKSAMQNAAMDIRKYFQKQATLPPSSRSYQVREDELIDCYKSIREIDSGYFDEGMAPALLSNCNSPLSRIN
jgi:hypothetical protein